MFGENAIHANFSVNDLSAAREFYCEKLGFQIIKEEQGQMLLGAGGATKILIYEKADHHAWDSTVLGIEVEDVRQALEQLEALGIMAKNVPGTDEQGVIEDPDMGSAAWLQDPAGNWVCISNIN